MVQVEGEILVNKILSELTLEEKFNLIRGVDEPHNSNQAAAGYLPGVPRLGIASMRFADGPPGILTREPSVAFPCTMAMAATFDKKVAYETGRAIALEAQRLGVDVALEPFINILRDYKFRRGFNTLGEDPVLCGVLGAEQIKGMQNQGIMAQAKHFVGFDSTGFDVSIDEQTLREIYVAPFEDAIKAGVSSVMTAYNKVNGEFASGSKSLLQGILRDELGFKGFTTSDWGSVHAADYIQKGLDMEMPGKLLPGAPWLSIMRSYFDNQEGPNDPLKYDSSVLDQVFQRPMPEEAPLPGEEPPKRPNQNEGQFPDDPCPENILHKLQKGEISESDLNIAVRRVLIQMERFGYLQKKGLEPTGGQVDSAVNQIALESSESSAVLLKNFDSALPLNNPKSVAMIGPGARQTIAVGINAEHSIGFVDKQVSPYRALQQALPDTEINLSVANDMTGHTIPAASWIGGVKRFKDGIQVATDNLIDFTKASGTELPADSLFTWEGTLRIDEDGIYGINLQMLGLIPHLEIDGEHINQASSVIGGRHGDTVQPGQDDLLPTWDGLNNVRSYVALTRGEHAVKIVTFSDTSGAPVQLRLNWTSESSRQALCDKAVEDAIAAEVAIVFAWGRLTPDYELLDQQNKLIEKICTANPNTIVVLNTSLPVGLPWIDKVKAVVQMWWSGDQGGIATANVLTGKYSPAGRLPFTWGIKSTDYPALDPRFPERGQQLDGIVNYSEGLDIGYRWFDREGQTPLFPFGHGLSYTKFEYKDLNVTQTGEHYKVSFNVVNTGAVDSDEVAQIYLSAPNPLPSDGNFAIKTLAGFERVHIPADGSAAVECILEPKRFQYYSVNDKRWKTVVSGRRIMIGKSANEICLTQALQ